MDFITTGKRVWVGFVDKQIRYVFPDRETATEWISYNGGYSATHHVSISTFPELKVDS